MSLITIQTTSFSSKKPRNERKDWKQVSPQSCNLSPYGLNLTPFTEFTALKKYEDVGNILDTVAELTQQ